MRAAKPQMSTLLMDWTLFRVPTQRREPPWAAPLPLYQFSPPRTTITRGSTDMTGITAGASITVNTRAFLITCLGKLQALSTPPPSQTLHLTSTEEAMRAGRRSSSEGMESSTRALLPSRGLAPLTRTPSTTTAHIPQRTQERPHRPPPRAATGRCAAAARPSSSARGLIGCRSSQSASMLRPPRESPVEGGVTPPSGANWRRPQRVPAPPPLRSSGGSRLAARVGGVARSFAPSARGPAPSRRALPGVCVLRHPPTRTGRAGVRRALRVTALGPGARRQPDGSSRSVSGLSVPSSGSVSFRRRLGRVRGRPSGAAGVSLAAGSRGRGLVRAADPAAGVARRPGSVRRGPAEVGGARGSAASLLHRRRHERGSVRPQLADPHLPGHGGGRAARRGHAGLRVRVHRLHPSQPDPNPARARAGGARPGPRRSGSGAGPCRPHRGPGEAAPGAPRGAGGAGWGEAVPPPGGVRKGRAGVGPPGEALGGRREEAARPTAARERGLSW